MNEGWSGTLKEHRFQIVLPPIPIGDAGDYWVERAELDLLVTAASLVDGEHTAAGIVVVQTTLEVMVDWALRMALRISVPAGAVDPLLKVVPDRTSMSQHTRAVWLALTGDNNITGAPYWKEYHAHVELRNRVVHAGFTPPKGDGYASLATCFKLITHLGEVVQSLYFRDTPDGADLPNEGSTAFTRFSRFETRRAHHTERPA